MAVTTTDSTLNIQKWRRDFWREYQRENLFAPYIGDGTDAVIHRIYELKDDGESITYPLVGRAKGAGQVGAATLAGNEEAMDQYGHKISIEWARHAILLNKKEMRKSAIDQLSVVKPLLKDWATSKVRDDIVYALANVGTVAITGNVNGITFGSATAGQRNTWVSDNARAVHTECERLGGKGLILQADVADQGAVEGMVASMVKEFGRLDGFVS